VNRRTALGLALVWIFGSSLAAQPAAASAVPVTATLRIQISTLDPLVVTGSGVALVNGSGGGAHLTSLALPGGIVQTTGFVLDMTDPGVLPIAGLQLTAENASGTFAGASGLIALGGVAKVCLFARCNETPPANLNVPLTVIGQGGTATVMDVVHVTVVGAPWGLATAAIPTSMGGSITTMGFRHGPASGTSSTAAPSGTLQLVTPISISTNIGAAAYVPAFAVLTLHFVPEPVTLTLLGAGIVALAARARRRLG
jgi:hypothetical protein